MRTTLEQILNCDEFQKLKAIGGHKVYHLEGDAWTHTMLVIDEAKRMFPDEPLMWRVAALHDVGKIYTSIEQGPGDWVYPDHAMCGSFKGVLAKFISLDDEDFERIQWYIKNHIKPLFWPKELTRARTNRVRLSAMKIDYVPEGCSIRNLARLAVCDIRGSKSVEDQSEKIAFLLSL